MSKNLNKLLVDGIQVGMKSVFDRAWSLSEKELMEAYNETISYTFNENNTPGIFAQMFVVAAFGEVLQHKYGVDRKMLVAKLKNSEMDFIKELKND